MPKRLPYRLWSPEEKARHNRRCASWRQRHEQQHRSHIAQYHKQWYAKKAADPSFRATMNESARAKYRSDLGKRRAYNRERWRRLYSRSGPLYRTRHREYTAARRQTDMKYQRSAKGRLAARHRAALRDFRVRGATGKHSQADWIRLKALNAYLCSGCGDSAMNVALTRDHIVPIVHGGTNDISNIQPLCGPCNSRKGAKLPVDNPFLTSLAVRA